MPAPLLTERLCLLAEPIVDLRAGLRVGEELVPVVSSSDHGAPQPFWERFDLDTLIRALTTDRESAATVARIVELAGDHGQRTVAESPGDLETLVALYEMGVDCAQDFWPSARRHTAQS